jgi:hypothetical protein
MRNLVTSVLPPGGHVVIKINPPLDEQTERPYVMTVRGSNTAVIDKTDPASIIVVNPSKKISPIVFFVGAIQPSDFIRQAILKLLEPKPKR